MPTSTTVKGLNINELTEAQYDAAVQGGVIGPNELSVLTDVSYVEPSDLATVATTGDYDDLINKPTIPAAIQVSSMPVASVDELDKIYQFVGATDASYTNGYFYKCVSDGQTPATYSWEQTDVQPAGSSLPSQTGHSGEFLTTDGTDASWAAVNALQNTATGTDGLTILGTASTVNYSINIGVNSKVSQTSGVAIGRGSEARAYQSSKLGTAIGTNAFVEGEAGVAIGANSCSYTNTSGYAVAIGGFANAYDYGIAIGTRTHVFNTAPGAIQLGNCWTNNTSPTQNMDAHTFKVGLRTGTNYELLSSDGTIPADRLPKAINKYSTMPTAASTNEGWIVQYTGATDATYTHGYIYECVSDGGNPATYSWTAVQVQAGGGGSLPSQTGNAGKFLTTDGTDASWAAISALQNTATGTDGLTILGTATTGYYNVNVGINTQCGSQNNTAIGYYAQTSTNASYSVAVGAYAYGWLNYCTAVGANANANKIGATSLGYRIGAENQSINGTYTVGVGYNSQTQADYAIAIGAPAKVTARCAIQIGGAGNSYGYTNSDANTFKVGNANGNFEIMSADGTIPTARLTKVNSTITIAVADWNGGTTVTKTVAGITATGVVLVSPDPTDQSAYTSAGILCTAQAADSLTFICSTTPSADIDVNVVML